MTRHIRLINIGYPPFTGGAQTYVTLLAESLVAAGDAAAVFTTDAGEVEAVWNGGKRRLPAEDATAYGVQVHRLPLRHLPPTPYGYYAARRALVALAQVPLLPTRLLWPLARFTPWLPGLPWALDVDPEPVDLVNGFAIPFESMLQAGQQFARRRGVPFVVTPFLHTGEGHDPTVERGYAMPHQLRLMREADAVVCLTSVERDFLLRRGLRGERLHVIPGGIPMDPTTLTEPVPPPADPPSILYLGAVTYDKGTVHLVQAISRLREAGVNVTLNIAGTVTDQFWRAVGAGGSGSLPGVNVLGHVSAADKARLLSEASALAMPSRVDSFGLVFLEAWAAGRPVIGARAGGIPAVIDHEQNGLLVGFGAVDELATAIRRLVEHPDEASALGLAGREKLRQQYTWDTVFGQVSALYNRLIAGR